MTQTRPAAVSGTFYPENTKDLKHMLQQYLSEAPPCQRVPKAIIVPHAGYIYSGAVAAAAFSQIKGAQNTIRKVVLLGPSHFVSFSGIAVPSVDEFKTPLGSVSIDKESIVDLERFANVEVSDQAHATEHSLEVELPFLQTVLDHFTLIPLAVSDVSAEEVAAVLEELWNGPQTLIVASSDLSHYFPYEKACGIDSQTANAITSLAPQFIENKQACGAQCIRGLLVAAKNHNLKVRRLDMRNSGDTAGSKDRVVGYGAFAFDEA